MNYLIIKAQKTDYPKQDRHCQTKGPKAISGTTIRKKCQLKLHGSDGILNFNLLSPSFVHPTRLFRRWAFLFYSSIQV